MTASRTIQSRKDLLVWQKAMDLVDLVYDLAESFPARENYGLTSRITSAAVSVPANIAEGHARSTRKDFANFLSIAQRSLMETETLLMVATRRNYIDAAQARDALPRVAGTSKMLTSLRSRIAARWREE